MGYYYCNVCGNVVYCEDALSSTLMCCGQKMEKCNENKEDGELSDKHIPVYKMDGNTIHIEVGEVLHPCTEKHHITFVELNTNQGKHVRVFKENEIPKCHFHLADDEKPINIRVYCNIHGLWRRDLD